MVQELPPLPRALGVASAALAGPPLLAPRRVARAIGVRDDAKTALITRAVGVHEAVAAAAILGLEAPRPQRSLWMRAGGDVAHGALLALALRRAEPRGRVAGALAFVAGCAVVDTYAAVRISRSPALGAPPKVREAVTIRKSPDDVRSAWNAFEFSSEQLEGSSSDADFVAFD